MLLWALFNEIIALQLRHLFWLLLHNEILEQERWEMSILTFVQLFFNSFFSKTDEMSSWSATDSFSLIINGTSIFYSQFHTKHVDIVADIVHQLSGIFPVLMTCCTNLHEFLAVRVLFSLAKSTWYRPNRSLYPLVHSKLSIIAHVMCPRTSQPSTKIASRTASKCPFKYASRPTSSISPWSDHPFSVMISGGLSYSFFTQLQQFVVKHGNKIFYQKPLVTSTILAVLLVSIVTKTKRPQATHRLEYWKRRRPDYLMVMAIPMP